MEEMSKLLDNLSGPAVRGEAVEMQPGSPNFDGAAAYEAFQKAGGYGAQLVPKFAGQFDTHQQWVNKAQSWLASPDHRRAICVDSLGRRMAIGADMAMARDEGTFPVRFFWECELVPVSPRAADAPSESSELPKPVCNLVFNKYEEWEVSEYEDQGEPVYFERDIERLIKSRAADAPSDPSDDYKLIARLIGIIFMAGDFVAETANERQLEKLLIKTGHRYKNWAEVDELNERAADALDSQPTELPVEIPTLRDLAMLFHASAFSNTAVLVHPESARHLFEAMTAAPVEASASHTSIGDDARFVTLLDEFIEARRFGGGLSRGAAYSAMTAYIDSRAPAAQAASVAPDGFVLMPINPSEAVLQIDGWPRLAWAHYQALLNAAAPQQEGSEAGK